MPAGTVEVFLIGATGIKDTELFGKADPYAILNCGKHKLRSNTASNQGSKPIWNQKFSFYIDDNASELLIKIFNHNILKEDDEIGSTIIPLARVFAEGKLPTTSYNVVRPSGRVQGEIKLSISFSPKVKAGQQTQQNVPGPYKSKVYGSPYTATPPEPKVKHDPLIGPYGYFRNSSSSSNSSSAGSSYGKSHSAAGSNHGSSKSFPDAYPPRVYPPVSQEDESPSIYQRTGSGLSSFSHSHSSSPSAYHHTDSSLSPYSKADSFSPSMYGSSHGPVYGTPSTSFNYGGSIYQHSPYGQGPQPSAPPRPSEAGPGSVPTTSGMPTYPTTPGVFGPSFPSIPSPNSAHGGVNQYSRYEELAGNFAGLNVSGNGSEYPRYQRTPSSNERPSSGYPPADLGSQGNYSGYHRPTNSSNDSPAGGYPPSGYHRPTNSSNDSPAGGYPPSGYPPAAGYPSHVDSSHGSFSRPGANPYGFEAPPPPSSYYPSQLGVSGQAYGKAESRDSFTGRPSDSYPPVPYYNAPPASYTPAGYPKSGAH